MYHIFITPTFDLNFLMKYGENDLLIIEIIFTIFHEKINMFTSRNERFLLFFK